MKKYKFKIEGLDCVNCANELEEDLRKIDIIQNVAISFMTERLTFECSEKDKTSAIEKIEKIVKKKEPNVKIMEV